VAGAKKEGQKIKWNGEPKGNDYDDFTGKSGFQTRGNRVKGVW